MSYDPPMGLTAGTGRDGDFRSIGSNYVGRIEYAPALVRLAARLAVMVARGDADGKMRSSSFMPSYERLLAVKEDKYGAEYVSLGELAGRKSIRVYQEAGEGGRQKHFLEHTLFLEPTVVLEVQIVSPDRKAFEICRKSLETLRLGTAEVTDGNLRSPDTNTAARWLFGRDRMKAEVAQGVLVKGGAEAARAIVDVYLDGTEAQSGNALTVLTKLGPVAVVPVVDLLIQGDINLKLVAAEILSRIADERAALPLLAQVETAEGRLRATLRRGVCRTGHPRAIETCSEWIRDNDSAVRKDAAQGLGRSKQTSALPLLLPALKDPDAGVRAAAAWGYGSLAPDRAPESLIALLADPDPKVRSATGNALEKIGDPASRQPMIDALNRADPETVRYLAGALAEFGDSEADAALASRAATGSRAAAWQLAEKGSTGITLLEKALPGANREGKTEIALVLGKFASEASVVMLGSLAADGEREVRSAAVMSLREIMFYDPVNRAYAVPVLIKALEDSDEGIARDAFSSLGKTDDPEAVKAVAPYLGKRGWGAGRVLGTMGRGGTDRLIEAAASPEKAVRLDAARGLGESGDQRAPGALASLLGDPSKRVAETASQGLSTMGGPGALALGGALGSSDGKVRLKAVRTLAEHRAPESIPPLIKALEDSNPDVRKYAIYGLGRKKDPRAAAALVELLRDPEEGKLAVRALKEYGVRKEVMKVYVEDEEPGRSNAVHVVCQWVGTGNGDREMFPLILEGLESRDQAVRVTCARAVSGFPDPRAVVPLVSLLDDESSDVKRAAAASLGETGSKDAVAPLVKILEGGDRSAAEALGRLGNLAAVDPLVEYLRNPQYRDKSSAIRALGEINDDRAYAFLAGIAVDEAWKEHRSTVIWAMQISGRVEAKGVAVKFLEEENDSSVRRAAASVVGSLGDESDLELLVKLVGDSDSHVKSHAAKALWRITGEQFGESARSWREWLDSRK